MKIVDQTIKIKNVSHALPFEAIEEAARKCFQSKVRDHTTARDFVQRLIEQGHMSPLEHVSFSIEFLTDRGVLLELTRHRICSFSVQSTRYVAQKEEVTFCRPVFWEKGSAKMKLWESNMQMVENMYHSMLESGMKPEEARTVLPNSLATRGVMTCNYRQLLHMLSLRCSTAAHPQIRALFHELRAGMADAGL